jgi:hypothetical protein
VSVGRSRAAVRRRSELARLLSTSNDDVGGVPKRDRASSSR